MSQFSEIYYADGAVGAAYNEQIRKALSTYQVPLASIAPANEPATVLIQTANCATRDDSSKLAQIKCRTLVINGRQDGLITPAAAQIVQKGIANSEILLLDRCGHFPFAEQPTALTQAVLKFASAR